MDASWESFPFELIEELKAKNLFPFVCPKESKCNHLSIEVYENQKYRPIIRDWGSVMGVHLFPYSDRRPFTDETGNKILRCSLSELQPLKGFKWAGDWHAIVESGTDEDGFQYARNWGGLRAGKASSSQKSMSFVRRRKWKRSMVIDLDVAKRSLPYEISVRVEVVPKGSSTLQSIALAATYIELVVDGDNFESGVLTAPSWSKEFHIPLTHLDYSKQFGLNFTRNGRAIAVLNGQKGSGLFTIGLPDILAETTKSTNICEVLVSDEKHYQLIARWKVKENMLFQVQTIQHFFSQGELSEMVLSENKISLRLKEKIIMLSLGLGSSCNGLLKEITNLIVEGEQKINDFDIIEILDDLNQIQSSSNGNNEFGKVISFLRDAEKQSNRITNMIYPYSIPCFHDCVLLQLEGWHSFRPKKSIMKELLATSKYNQSWFEQQPACLSHMMLDYHSQYQRDMKSAAASSVASSYLYSIRLLIRNVNINVVLSWNHVYDYFTVLKWLSMIKYHTSGLYPNIDKNSNPIAPGYETLTMAAHITIDGHLFSTGVMWVDFEEECIDFGCDAHDQASINEANEYLPVRVAFEDLESVIVSHSHHVAFDRMLEIKLLSATSFTLQGSYDYHCRVDIDTITGQHGQVEFHLQQEGSGQPATGVINDTVRVLIPRVKSSLMGPNIESTLDSFVSIALSVESQQSPANNSNSSKSSSSSSSSHRESISGNNTSNSFISDASPNRSFEKKEKPSSGRYFPSFSSSSSSGQSSSNLNSSSSASSNQVLYGNNSDAFSVSMLQANNKSTSSSSSSSSSNKKGVSTGNPFLRLGTVSLPTTSAEAIRDEKEIQLVLDKKPFQLSLKLKQIQWVNSGLISPTDYDEDPEIYCLIFFTDRHGQVIPLTAGLDMSATSSPSKKSKSSSSSSSSSSSNVTTSSNGIRSGYLQRTSTITLLQSFYWEDEEITLDSKLYPAVETAVYFLVEVWRKNKIGEDYCVGESYLPIHSTTSLQDEDGKNCKHMIRTPSSSMVSKRRFSSIATMYDVGYLLAKLTVKPTATADVVSSSHNNNNISTSRTRANMRSNLLKIAMSIKPIQSTDCAWPCQILSATDRILEPTVFHFSVAQDGINIQLLHHATAQHSQDRISVLEECLERKSTLQMPLHLLIAYNAIDIQDLFVLCDHTLYIALKFRRQFQAPNSSGATGASAASKTISREIRIEFIVGPCLAEDLFAAICNRVALQPIRTQLHGHVALSNSNNNNSGGANNMSGNSHIAATQQKELEESFNKLAKLFHDHIYDTISSIEQRKLAIDMHGQINTLDYTQQVVEEDPLEEDVVNDGEEDDNDAMTIVDEVNLSLDQIRISDPSSNSGRNSARRGNNNSPTPVSNPTSTNSTNNNNSLVPVFQSIEEEWDHFALTNRCSCAMKLLYLKMTTLKIYLWFLVEQTPLQFSAEKHYLDASWILFDEKAMKSGTMEDASFNVNDLDTLLFRITDIMKRLEQEIRHQIFRAYRSNNQNTTSDSMEDIVDVLSKTIYSKYIAIMTMLLETLSNSDIAASSAQQQQLHHNNNTQNNSNKSAGSSSSTATESAKQVVRKGSHGGRQSYHINNPQKKRDLIKFIITNDDIFENYLNAILRSHRYTFNTRPLLSVCLNFDMLITTFGDILDENILMWNSRTLKHFMNAKDFQGNVGGFRLPWDITFIHDKSVAKEFYISNIPETIQMQLNVEIGLKKIAPTIHTMTHCFQNPLSLHRIDCMNMKIAQAIARSYISLVFEYEKVMQMTIHRGNATPASHARSSQLLLRDTAGSASNSSSLARNNNTPQTRQTTDLSTRSSSFSAHAFEDICDVEEKEDQIICFLASILNDCYRIRSTHIPQSIDLFVTEYPPQQEAMMAMVSSSTSRRSDALPGDVESDDLAATVSFSTCLKAINTLSLKVLNHLSNQICFQSELKVYFLVGLDTMYLNDVAKFQRYRSSLIQQQDATAVQTNAEYAAIEVILATMTEFLQYINQHLHADDMARIFYLLMKKIILRYLLFLRDFHTYQSTFAKKSHSRNNNHNNSANSNVQKAAAATTTTAATTRSRSSSSGGASDDEEGRRSFEPRDDNEDREQQQQLHGLSREDSNQSNSSATTGSRQHRAGTNNSARDDADEVRQASSYIKADDVSTRGRFKHDLKQIMSFYGHIKKTLFPKTSSSASSGDGKGDHSAGGHAHRRPTLDPSHLDGDANQQQHPGGDNELEGRFDGMLGLMLNTLSNSVAYASAEEWPGPELVNNFFSRRFGVQLPVFNPDPFKYFPLVDTTFKTDPTFIHFIPPIIHENFHADETKLCTIQVSNLACFHAKKHKSLFMKIYLNESVENTSFQANTSSTLQWDDNIVFEKVPVSTCKVMKIELYGFKLAAIKSMREFWVGTVYINLVDLLRSEMEAASSHSSAVLGGSTGGPRGLSFSANRVAMNMKDMRGSISMNAASNGFSHTAWYVAGSTGIFQKLRGKQDHDNPALIASTTTHAYDIQNYDNNSPKGKNDPINRNKVDKNKANAVSTTNTSSLSNVYAISSRGPREDIDSLQMRVTIRAVFV